MLCRVVPSLSTLEMTASDILQIGRKCGAPDFPLENKSPLCDTTILGGLTTLTPSLTTLPQEKLYEFRNKQGCKVPSHIPNCKVLFSVTTILQNMGAILGTYPTATYQVYVHQTKFFEFRSSHLHTFLQKNVSPLHQSCLKFDGN